MRFKRLHWDACSTQFSLPTISFAWKDCEAYSCIEDQTVTESVTALAAASSSPSKRQKENPATVPPSPKISSSLVVTIRSVDDNPAARQSWELEKLKDAITCIRQELESECDRKTLLYNKFNYPSCYDITFFQALACEFKIDVSHFMSKKRVLLKDVVIFIIYKLVV